MSGPGDGGNALLSGNFSDEDFRRTMVRALRLSLGATAVLWPAIAWKMGWQSGVLFGVGALISGSGLWEWMRVMTAVMARMDGGEQARPMGLLLAGFFGRLGLVLAVLYGSLKLLDGSVLALAGGLALGMVALTFEGLRLTRAWTV